MLYAVGVVRFLFVDAPNLPDIASLHSMLYVCSNPYLDFAALYIKQVCGQLHYVAAAPRTVFPILLYSLTLCVFSLDVPF